MLFNFALPLLDQRFQLRFFSRGQVFHLGHLRSDLMALLAGKVDEVLTFRGKRCQLRASLLLGGLFLLQFQLRAFQIALDVGNARFGRCPAWVAA